MNAPNARPAQPRNSPDRRSRMMGFSLVEIVMAIGIVSFAMVSIMGIIPVGLNSFRNAINLSVESSIAQRLASDIQRTESTNQISSQTNFYYDADGLEVGASNAIFTAEVNPPRPITTDGIMRSNAPASTVLIKIRNRLAPTRTNSYPVVIQSDS